ncbi:hypothetical protein LF1_11580 [Rubripirellula obstinata]|uniref:Uncharacterized protein n=1 Tax=Rubripirellula obstinata TaxID=406547 RepID=A0A5B1CDH6_9BACT|nr:hypothetical protein [Rubripirellula obstinata]KAA1258636.1 hypothetical protein LF1_11580 [Rubripirellula obstinata]
MPATLDDRLNPGGEADGSDGTMPSPTMGRMPSRTPAGAKRPPEPRRRAKARRRGEPTRDSPKARRAWTIAVEWAAGAWMPPERRPWKRTNANDARITNAFDPSERMLNRERMSGGRSGG